MRKLAVGVLFAGLLAACGGNNKKKTIVPLADAPIDMGAACNVLMQTGCTNGQKCTWIHDTMTVGHIGCAQNGTIPAGGTCMYGAPGSAGYDNCTQGNICIDAECKQICDQNGGPPMCGSAFACGIYSGVFGPVQGPYAAGACDPRCDPLADNTFGSNHTKTGTTCGSAKGCYGLPDLDPNSGLALGPTKYTCVGDFQLSQNPPAYIYHRTACTNTNGCGPAPGQAYLNGCSQGYVPWLIDATGSMQVDCISYCAPASCYSGHCGTGLSGNLLGDPAQAHLCNTTDSNGSFQIATLGTQVDGPAGNNGDQCAYFWVDEQGSNMLYRTSETDKIGYCYRHSVYLYDPTGGMNPTTPLPKCDTLTTPGFGSNVMNLGAADLSCVDTVTAGVPLQGNVVRHVHLDLPHPPYHLTNRTLTP